MKRKYKELFICYILSIILVGISNYFLHNITLSIIIGILLFILLKFYVFNKIYKANILNKSLNNFSHLVNSLIMQITVTPNVSMSLIEISSFLDEKEKEVFLNDELLVKEKLDSIEKNYNFPLFQVFKEIINLYDTQGGNIIEMSLQLLSQIDSYIKNVEVIRLDNNKKIGEVVVLWLFSLFATFYIKQVLYDYYMQIITNQIFQYIIFFYFILLIFSIYFISKNYIEVKIGD